jgi:hypothetical protein
MTQTIEVYCDDPSHEPRRWVVDVLARNEHGWHPADWGKSGRKGAKSTLQFINDGHVDLNDRPLEGPDRTRYKFRCGLCAGRCVEVRFERGKVVFDTLFRNGYDSISLASLAAIV